MPNSVEHFDSALTPGAHGDLAPHNARSDAPGPGASRRPTLVPTILATNQEIPALVELDLHRPTRRDQPESAPIRSRGTRGLSSPCVRSPRYKRLSQRMPNNITPRPSDMGLRERIRNSTPSPRSGKSRPNNSGITMTVTRAALSGFYAPSAGSQCARAGSRDPARMASALSVRSQGSPTFSRPK